MTDETVLENILEQVRDYYHLRFPRKDFQPGKDRVHYSGRVFDEKELLSLVRSSLDFWLTLGPYGDRFESAMKDFFGSQDFALVNSGSSANLLAVSTLCSSHLEHPLCPGDEVLTPAVTFPTTLTPLLLQGLIPVFVDVETETLNVHPDRLEEAVSPKTRAMMLPHTLGNPLDMERVLQVKELHHLYLIEDCCDALDSAYGGRKTGTFGEMATLSFYPAHHITMGEGGGVVVNDASLAGIVRSIRDWGRDCWCPPGKSDTCGKRFGWQLGSLPNGYDHKYIYSNLGFNLKPTDLQAAVGLAQLEKLSEFTRRRKENFRFYYEALKPFEEFLILPRWHPKADPSWFGFPITVRPPLERRQLIWHLEDANIETRLVFAGNILRQPAFRNIARRVAGDLECTDEVMERTFFIGVYPGLTFPMREYVLSVLESFFKKIRRVS